MMRTALLVLSIAGAGFFSVHGATVSGVVTDTGTTAAPLNGAIVTLSPLGGGAATFRDTTDTTGAYSIAAVTAATYRISATKAGYRSSTAATLVVGTADTSYAIKLTPLPAGVTVSGTVTDSGATTTVSGATVTLRSGATIIATKTTGTDGAYAFDSVQAGMYTIRVTMTGYTTKTTGNLTVASAAVTANIQLVKTIYATVSGVVSDSAAGAPDSGAVVTLRSGNLVIKTDTTGATGAYSFDSVVTGYSIRAVKAGYVTKTIAALTVTSATPITENIKLVKIVYMSVSGTVTDSVVGTNVGGVTVTLRSGGVTVATKTTGTDGAYAFDSVEAGAYTIRAALAGYTTKTSGTITVASAAVTANIQLVKIIYATVSGVVSDSAAGTPDSGVVVTLRSGNFVVKTDTTGATGAYSFDSVITGYSIRATKTGYVTKNTAALTVTTATPITENIQLVKILYATVSGTVTDSVAGTPDSGVVVTLRSGGATIKTVTTGAAGTYSFDSASTGYTIRATKTGYVSKTTAALTVTGATPITENIQLVKIVYVTVSGIVTDSASGAAKQGAIVTLRSGFGGAALATDTTSATGAYSFDSVATGTYTVRVVLAGYATKNVTADVGVAALKVNVALVPQAGVVNPESKGVAGKFAFGISAAGQIHLANCTDAGVVKIFGLNGKQLYCGFLSANSTSLSLPAGIVKTGNTCIVSISQGKATFRKQVVMP